MLSVNLELLNLENQFCFSLDSASVVMSKAYKSLLRPFSLTYSQFLVLTVLWEVDNLSMSAIGERLFLNSGTLTPLLKKLDASGFIRREFSFKDERQVLIQLTIIGRNVRKKASSLPDTLLAACQCSIQETKQLIKKINKIRNSLIHDNKLNLRLNTNQKRKI